MNIECAFVVSTMARKVKQKPIPGVSFCLMGFFVVAMLFMNIHQMLRLEETNHHHHTSRSATTSLVRSKTTSSSTPRAAPKQHYVPIPTRPSGTRKDLVKAGDYIYYQDEQMSRWDAAPIVIESHKLLFFSIPKVGCTVWKQLFRRMMGYKDWKLQDGETFVPHNPEFNGLKYLYNYSLQEASVMMTSPEWTRAVMVRDPKHRFLSAFLDKAVSNDHQHIFDRCCKDSLNPEACVEDAQTIEGFLKLCSVCEDGHWRSQHARLESKYWPYIDWVGHVETAAQDAKKLLQQIGAWEDFGQTGWGQYGNATIFHSKEVGAAGSHATWSEWKHWEWYNPEAEAKVERFFRADYENPLFNFTKNQCLTCESLNA